MREKNVNSTSRFWTRVFMYFPVLNEFSRPRREFSPLAQAPGGASDSIITSINELSSEMVQWSEHQEKVFQCEILTWEIFFPQFLSIFPSAEDFSHFPIGRGLDDGIGNSVELRT